ncbi:MAG: VOC family protein [Chloroflexi bacterium]|nr:VOC family protein [Chloroflexota bacterium]
MGYEIDHILIMADRDAPQADRLVELGFSEGAPNTHPGQGTANRRFFFSNFMLEFNFVVDEDEASSDLTAPTYLLERWQGRNGSGSPFGICLRPDADGAQAPPFSTWPYQPSYLPAGKPIDMAHNAAKLDEPLLFYVGWISAAPINLTKAEQPIEHPNGASQLTAVELVMPLENHSAELQSFFDLDLVHLLPAEQHHLSIIFDEGRQGQSHYLDPQIPLRLRW